MIVDGACFGSCIVMQGSLQLESRVDISKTYKLTATLQFEEMCYICIDL